MTRKLTRITPVVNGYAVVVAQELGVGGKPGGYIGCFLQTPESADDGPLILLAEAMKEYLQKSRTSQIADEAVGHTAMDLEARDHEK